MNEKKQHGVETIKSWQEKLHKKEKTKQKQQPGRAGWQVVFQICKSAA